MLTSILAEALAVTSDNLSLAKFVVDCAEDIPEDISAEAKQRLALVQTGLAFAIQGLECDELQQFNK